MSLHVPVVDGRDRPLRLALHRYAVNVNQVAAALNSGRHAPIWLSRAVAGRIAVSRIDTAAEKPTQLLAARNSPNCPSGYAVRWCSPTPAGRFTAS